jgi:hypothetical protein
MKKLSFPLGIVCCASFCAFVNAQERPAPSPATQPRIATATMAVPLPIPPTVEVDIRDQPDSPIHLSVDDAVKGRLPGTPLKVRNDSGSVVAAFVLRVDVEPFGLGQMVIAGPKGLAVGDARTHGLSMINYREGSAKPVVSVDFVHFADGKTWGEDSLGKSKNIAAYLKGRADALSRLQELLAGQDASEINKALETFSSASFAEPNLPAGRPPRYIDYSARGYEEVINILRRMPRNTELGRDLANRLETMAKRSDQ